MAEKATIIAKAQKKRNKLSDSQLKSEILAVLNSGISGKMEVFGNIRNKFTCARDRFTKMYDLCYSEWGTLKAMADSEATTKAAGEAARIGLKSKLEKQMMIQKQIEGMEAELTMGYWMDIVIVRRKEREVKKVLNPLEKTSLRKAIKDLYAELNKMEGDYAPTKIASTDKEGNDVKPLNDAELDKMLSKIEQLLPK